MPKSLVIVESPTKEKTINKILGTDFVVKSSMGHVKDLPTKELGVDIDNNYEPKYVSNPKQKKVVSDIKSAAAKVDSIYVATDPDREGEAIGWHIADELKSLKKPIYRIVFNEITKTAIKEGISHPGKLDECLYNAQQSRRILDRLVGFKISPVLWKTMRGGRSAGRVQSVAVRLICEREEEIQRFISQEYWSILAQFDANGRGFEGKLVKISNDKIGSPLEKGVRVLKNKEEVDGILSTLNGAEFRIESITKKRQLRNPSAPFITSTLQQEASRKLGFSSSRTMRVAQDLYEGIDVGSEGPVGLITYMRTDSTRISTEAIQQVRTYIQDKYGVEYLPPAPREYVKKKGNVQDAHEAIRPTYFEHDPDNIKKFLAPDQFKLYKLIWERFIACQMKSAELDITTVDINAKDHIFRTTGSIISFPGFIQVYMEGRDEDQSEDHEGEIEGMLPDLKEKQVVDAKELLPRQHATEPPARYNEATLVRELEEKGIGRPSTYAAIVDTIVKRSYVEKIDKRFFPTILGQVITKLLIASFPVIMEVKFTAHMEDDLDEIEEGKMEWIPALNEFFLPFKDALEKAPDIILEFKKQLLTVAGENCEKCGLPMIIRFGSDGSPFMGCSGYPECKTTKNIDRCGTCQKPVLLRFNEKNPPNLVCSSYNNCDLNTKMNNGQGDASVNNESTEDLGNCPKCSSKLIKRISKYGPFIACSNYPKCRYIQPEVTGVKCPNEGCDGDIVARFSAKGKFYGCSKYPTCKFILSNKPIIEVCPDCQAPFLLEVYRKEKKIIKCHKKECGYQREEALPPTNGE